MTWKILKVNQWFDVWLVILSLWINSRACSFWKSDCILQSVSIVKLIWLQLDFIRKQIQGFQNTFGWCRIDSNLTRPPSSWCALVFCNTFVYAFNCAFVFNRAWSACSWKLTSWTLFLKRPVNHVIIDCFHMARKLVNPSRHMVSICSPCQNPSKISQFVFV